MFPGFATLFKDDEKKIHLFFYNGLDENLEPTYKDLDLPKTGLAYEQIDNADGSKEYIFKRKDILKMRCKLIKKDGTYDLVELECNS